MAFEAAGKPCVTRGQATLPQARKSAGCGLIAARRPRRAYHTQAVTRASVRFVGLCYTTCIRSITLWTYRKNDSITLLLCCNACTTPRTAWVNYAARDDTGRVVRDNRYAVVMVNGVLRLATQDGTLSSLDA